MAQTLITEAQFRQACGQFATGVAVATASDQSGAPHGLTINSFTSVSMTPPMVLICIDYRAQVLQVFLKASHYAVNILSHSQQDISNRFAYRAEDRFSGVAWQRGETGAPLIEGALAAMECATRRVMEGGDHTILLAEVVAVHAEGGDPLLYFNSRYHRIG
jgi:flavin reductase (DIM6/NTAB) family NADH-FMN oxidoreductase RutF